MFELSQPIPTGCSRVSRHLGVLECDAAKPDAHRFADVLYEVSR